ncbi:MAG: protein adenylyltransferase SelO family protein [Halospina sp.]
MKVAEQSSFTVANLDDLAKVTDYSFMDRLDGDPEASASGNDHEPRQVFRGHYVPVTPTPIEDPEYVAHSKDLFRELGFADSMAQSTDFVSLFSGDITTVPESMKQVGWACGYALSIYGTELVQQCPFQTGNGYGDGRAISVVEVVIEGQRWEMQLKGAGRTPFCRGADGRAVLRSSAREFLAQEHMHALGVPTSRSLSLYVSKTETVRRPWYSGGSRSTEPDTVISEPVAITTRVAPSFIRVGQLELFSRRARRNEHPHAMEELAKIVLHLIDTEYGAVIDHELDLPRKVLLLAREFRSRLTSLIANWIRVGYCQGNFNSDNCAAGGFTLDYGPFGFCEVFDPYYQPWTGGGDHFSFLNQPEAAYRNFQSFCSALRPLLEGNQDHLWQLDRIQREFPAYMQAEMEAMWAAKLGLDAFDAELFSELKTLMVQTPVDYTIFFRELSEIPVDIGPLRKSFYRELGSVGSTGASMAKADRDGIEKRWSEWLNRWQSLVGVDSTSNCNADPHGRREALAHRMKRVNPKYTLREWFVVPAYQQASKGNYTPLRKLQDVMTQPYAEQSNEVEAAFYRLKPRELFNVGGVSYYNCSS